MATPTDKLADSLEALHTLQAKGQVVIRSRDLTRTHRERLCRNGFLQEVIKGWYIPTRPDEKVGDSTAWYTSFWQFCAAYLHHLKGNDWYLSPEQSIALHAENWTVPKQLLIRAPKARNNVTTLPHGTSLLEIRAAMPTNAKDITEKNGLRILTLPAALTTCAANAFKQNPTDMRATLAKIRDASEILEHLLEGGHSTIAGRLAGAFRNIKREQIADDIVNTMQAAGYDVRENDPFTTATPILLSTRQQSPYVHRIQLMWQTMRPIIIDCFPKAPGLPRKIKTYLKSIEDNYVTDAYHSLSIEGYRVNRQLIEHVRSGNWNSDQNENDREQHNALAARGYWQSFNAVHASIEKILQGDPPGLVVENDHRIWYRELFAPGVQAGIHQPAELAGYRNNPVYIRQSMHVPPNQEAVRDTMPAFFDLLRTEKDPGVRVVLGHFIFVYIHPYMDGNGRIGRFLMNAMLASGGYPWTIIPLAKRNAYMAALEEASAQQNIEPFATFLAELVRDGRQKDQLDIE